MQAEYQTHLKEQYYLDQINKDKEESQASLEGANERLEGVKRTKEAQGREASEAMQAMEVAHTHAALGWCVLFSRACPISLIIAFRPTAILLVVV